jgi:hypothetical protein
MVPLWLPIIVVIALIVELHLAPFIGCIKVPSISHALRGMQARQHSCSLEGLRSASYNYLCTPSRLHECADCRTLGGDSLPITPYVL